MKTTSKPKAPANTAPAPVKQDPTPAWAIGSATVDIHNDAKVARALACLLKEISGYAPTDPEEVEERHRLTLVFIMIRKAAEPAAPEGVFRRPEHQVELHLPLVAAVAHVGPGVYFPVGDAAVSRQAEAPLFRVIAAQIVDLARQLRTRDSGNHSRPGEIHGHSTSGTILQLKPDGRAAAPKGDPIAIPASHIPPPRPLPLALKSQRKFGVWVDRWSGSLQNNGRPEQEKP